MATSSETSEIRPAIVYGDKPFLGAVEIFFGQRYGSALIEKLPCTEYAYYMVHRVHFNRHSTLIPNCLKHITRAIKTGLGKVFRFWDDTWKSNNVIRVDDR